MLLALVKNGHMFYKSASINVRFLCGCAFCFFFTHCQDVRKTLHSIYQCVLIWLCVSFARIQLREQMCTQLAHKNVPAKAIVTQGSNTCAR